MTNPRIDHESWLLVADGEKALFLQNQGDAELPDFRVRRVEAQDNPSDHDQSANKPGQSGSGNPSADTVGDTDWHKIAKERFAVEMAELLYKMVHKGRFRKIALVAPPQVLGDMRPKLHKEVQACLVGEVAKDYTNHPLDKIEQAFKAQ